MDYATRTAFTDVQNLHKLSADEMSKKHPQRHHSLLRKQTKRAPASNGGQLDFGQSVMVHATYVGAGVDGFVLRTKAADYYEMFGPARAEAFHRAGGDVIIKVREIMPMCEYLRMTLIRELFMGSLVRAVSMPFVCGLRRWWIWNGQEAPNSGVRAWQQISERIYTPDMASVVTKTMYDITDFLSCDTQTKVRARICGASSSPNNARRVETEYVNRQRARLQSFGVFHYAMLEQESAGYQSLYRTLRDNRIFSCNVPGNWNFFRSVMLTIGQQLSVVQHQYRFVHGDASVSNIVMSQHTTLPKTMDGFITFGSDGVARFLRPEDFVAPGSDCSLLPTFVDLSRSSVSALPLSFQLDPTRAKSFDGDSWQHLYGYTRTLDIRRIGLSLAHLVVTLLLKSNSKARITLDDLDMRIVSAVRAMVDGPAICAQMPNIEKSGTSLHSFFADWLYVVDTLDLIRLAKVASTGSDERKTLCTELNKRVPAFFLSWESCSQNINGSWRSMLERHPQMEDNDICLPESFINWDVWRQ